MDDSENRPSSSPPAATAAESSTTTTTTTSDQQQQQHQVLLSQLMAALAAGARAVQGLPLGDDFDYQSSFPEFRSLLEESQESLLGTLLMTLEESTTTTTTHRNNMSTYEDDNNNNNVDMIDGDGHGGGGSSSSLFHFESLDDPLLYEACSDLCEALLEQAERSYLEGGGNSNNNNEQVTKELLAATQRHAQTSFGRLLSGIVEMEKPQEVYSFGAGADAAELNRRARPFVPPYLEKKYHAKEALDSMESLKRHGHGLETKFGETRKKSSVRIPNTIVAPDCHYVHPYLPELQSLQYPAWELESSVQHETKSKKSIITIDENLTDTAKWIDTPEALAELKFKLEQESVREVAIDLEAHSYRSFGGMICLIQISFADSDDQGEKPTDYLIDPFPVWDDIHNTLAPTLANPNVVKVFHGADSDVAWLQRDFGLYVVNLFDTGRAARALKFPFFGFAHVLERYVDGARADKSHQLADWRQRPLPEAMKEYAIMDTHYLLDIYRSMKHDLAKSKTTSIEEVLEESRRICTIRYAPEPFRPDGYRSLMQRRGHQTELNSRQEEVLKELWDWRDQTARLCDESQVYVCTNTQLMRLAMACPTNLSTLQSLMQPMPPLLIRNSKEVLSIIQNRLKEQQRAKNAAGPPSSAFFKPAVSTRSEDVDDAGENRPSPRSLMSPVLGTEALYRQAGWISPANQQFSGDLNDLEGEEIATTSATEDDADDEKDEVDDCRTGKTRSAKKNRKPRRGVAVHEANQNFQSQRFSSHSLQLGGGAGKQGERGEVIDGFGPVRAVHSSVEDMEEAVEIAKTNAAQIRTTQESRGIIGLMSAAELASDEIDNEDDGDDEQEEEREKSDQEEFVIPRSMREIYRISNRNRRNKKITSPGPPDPKLEEMEELAKAEEVLKARLSEGKNYIDVIPIVPGSPKRQRTKSLGAASLSSSDEAGGGHDSMNKSREDDIALMQEIGWIDNKEEVDNMLKGRQHTEGDDDDSSDDGGGGKRGETPKTFDYSSVGPIGAFAPTPPPNPFFAGAALTGGHLTQQFGKSDKKKTAGPTRSFNKSSRRQTERPERRDGKSQAYKKK